MIPSFPACALDTPAMGYRTRLSSKSKRCIHYYTRRRRCARTIPPIKQTLVNALLTLVEAIRTAGTDVILSITSV